MSEVWKAIPGFEGLYEVSDQGRVRSLDRVLTVRTKLRSGRVALVRKSRQGCLLKPGVASNGYPTVALCGATHCVHILVLTAFRGPCPEGMLCRHLDGVRSRCDLSNLVWGTPVENAADTVRHGTKVIGEQHVHAKLTDATALEIRRLRGEVSQNALAERFGVSPAAVQAVHDGRTWKHV